LKVKKDAFSDASAAPDDSRAPFLLIFTDLDGTLLDRETYGWEGALPALEACRARGVPVVLVSSKTRAEIEELRDSMPLSAPFISENGGGIFFLRHTFVHLPPGSVPAPPTVDAMPSSSGGEELWMLPLGISYCLIVKALQEIRQELGLKIRGFSDMGIEEISRLTGLDRAGARLAKMREYDEPFIFPGGEPEDLAPLHDAAGERDLQIASGGRFYPLQGKNDKGTGMDLVTDWYKGYHGRVVTVALGDSPNDFSMLERADFPVLIRSGRTFPGLKQRIHRLRITDVPGPEGWNSAVFNILNMA